MIRMQRPPAFAVAAVASLTLGACGGGDHAAPSPLSAVERVRSGADGVCGDALARVMERAFISPSSSMAVRLRARKTLDLIATHRATVEPVCASRGSVEPVVATP